jgi:hypothetical protein
VNLTPSFSAILTASSTYYCDFKGDVNKIVGKHFSLEVQLLYKQYDNRFSRTVQAKKNAGRGF